MSAMSAESFIAKCKKCGFAISLMDLVSVNVQRHLRMQNELEYFSSLGDEQLGAIMEKFDEIVIKLAQALGHNARTATGACSFLNKDEGRKWIMQYYYEWRLGNDQPLPIDQFLSKYRDTFAMNINLKEEARREFWSAQLQTILVTMKGDIDRAAIAKQADAELFDKLMQADLDWVLHQSESRLERFRNAVNGEEVSSSVPKTAKVPEDANATGNVQVDNANQKYKMQLIKAFVNKVQPFGQEDRARVSAVDSEYWQKIVQHDYDWLRHADIGRMQKMQEVADQIIGEHKVDFKYVKPTGQQTPTLKEQGEAAHTAYETKFRRLMEDIHVFTKDERDAAYAVNAEYMQHIEAGDATWLAGFGQATIDPILEAVDKANEGKTIGQEYDYFMKWYSKVHHYPMASMTYAKSTDGEFWDKLMANDEAWLKQQPVNRWKTLRRHMDNLAETWTETSNDKSQLIDGFLSFYNGLPDDKKKELGESYSAFANAAINNDMKTLKLLLNEDILEAMKRCLV